MKRAVALGATILLSMVGIAGCSSSEPDPASAIIPDVVVPTQPPVSNTGALEVTKAPTVPQRTEISPNDFSNIVEMKVGERLPITGLPDDTVDRAIFVGTDKAETLTISQQPAGLGSKAVNNPTVEALAPGFAEVTIYETRPSSSGQEIIGEFSIHVYGGEEAPWGTDANGLLGFLASGDVRVGDAVKAAEDAGYTVRIISIDGKALPVTKDYSENRLNFVVQDGVVTGVTLG